MSRLDEIAERVAWVIGQRPAIPLTTTVDLVRSDVPWLIAEVERLAAIIDAGPDLEAVTKFLSSAKECNNDDDVWTPIMDEYTALSFAHGIRALWRQQTRPVTPTEGD